MIQALLLAQILFYTLPSGYPPVKGRGVMILGFGIEPMVIRPEAMESYLPTVVHRTDWTMASVPWVEMVPEHPIPQAWVDVAAQRITNPQDDDWYVVADPIADRFTPLSRCYRPGEAHNELTLPCVTIEP